MSPGVETINCELIRLDLIQLGLCSFVLLSEVENHSTVLQRRKWLDSPFFVFVLFAPFQNIRFEAFTFRVSIYWKEHGSSFKFNGDGSKTWALGASDMSLLMMLLGTWINAWMTTKCAVLHTCVFPFLPMTWRRQKICYSYTFTFIFFQRVFKFALSKKIEISTRLRERKIEIHFSIQ